MDLITTHINADFDALGSLVAAKKLYPNSRLLLPGSQEQAVRDFLALAKELVVFESERECRLYDVTRLVLVDTRNKSRIGIAAELIDKGVEVHIYDHHPRMKGDVTADKDTYENVGATVTVLADIIKKKGIKLTPLEATIMLLGIYEDTGSLTYRTTTKLDVDMVSFLLSKGANLSVVSAYINRELTEGELALLTRLISVTKKVPVKGLNISIAEIDSESYSGELGLIIHKLMEIENIPVLFVIIDYPGKGRVDIIGRSSLDAVDVNKILSRFGGGGHPGASSAKVRGEEAAAVKERLINTTSRMIKSKARPGDIMSKKVSASDRNMKAGATGKVLIEEVSKEVTTNLSNRMERLLPPHIMRLLHMTGSLGSARGYKVFIIGGLVRDLLMGAKNLDLDIVVEGDAVKLGQILSRKMNASLVVHKRFGTCTVVPQDGPKIDLASARKEVYERPAALPTIEFSSLKEDLLRRDFTINAMASSLNRPTFGRLIDFFNGEKDLRSGRIRVLHDGSFIDDPTRIFRAVRFEQRLGFKIDAHTESLIKKAIKKEMFKHVEPQRIRDEVVVILKEERPLKALNRMAELDELRFLHPRIKFTKDLAKLYDSINKTCEWYEGASFRKRGIEKWLLYFMALLHGLSYNDVSKICDRFVFRKGERIRILSYKERADSVLRSLEGRSLLPSRVYRLLEPLSFEVILLLYARARSKKARSRIVAFFRKYNGMKTLIKGNDLKILGLKPCPDYKKILDKILYAKIDGRLKSKDDEINYAKNIIDKVCV